MATPKKLGPLKRVQKNSALGIPGSRSREYIGWAAMMQRCSNPNHHKYKNYGGRGIRVCTSWQQFKNFYSDMGRKPAGMTIGRIDNDGPYSPENCRWEPNSEQCRNKSTTIFISIGNERKSLMEWSAIYGVSPRIARDRIRLGWRGDMAVTTQPIREKTGWQELAARVRDGQRPSRIKRLGREPNTNREKEKVLK